MNTTEEILAILDHGAEDGVFPMLDNPYVYLATTRLNLYRSEADWALVFEIFGFSPRAGMPDLGIWTFASRLRDRTSPKHRSPEAHQRYLAQHPNDESRFFYPIERGDWRSPDNDAIVADDATEIVLRGEPVRLPTLEGLEQHGVPPSRPPRVLVFEVCRFLAEIRRDRVLATDEERRVNVPTELKELLRLDDWNHPDLMNEEIPSGSESFQQLAAVLASGDIVNYRPTSAPNTHWTNWPDGGRS
jgi:hypothetical protein